MISIASKAGGKEIFRKNAGELLIRGSHKPLRNFGEEHLI